MIKADRPKGDGGREYHLHTQPGDIAPLCILVGSPQRAMMIGNQLFDNAKLVGDHRGLASYTGWAHGHEMSVVTTGMGGASLGTVLPEAARCGAKMFIRVGSCSSLLEDPAPGDVIIVSAAARLDGASLNWAPVWYPAVASHFVVTALERALMMEDKSRRFYTGVEASTDCFNEGQGRDCNGPIPSHLRVQHQELLRLGAACYSMEASTLFTWCATHNGGMPRGAINAVYGNRVTNAFEVAGEELAARVAIRALADLAEAGEVDEE